MYKRKMGYMRRGFFVLNSSPTSSEAALYAAQKTPNSWKIQIDDSAQTDFITIKATTRTTEIKALSDSLWLAWKPPRALWSLRAEERWRWEEEGNNRSPRGPGRKKPAQKNKNHSEPQIQRGGNRRWTTLCFVAGGWGVCSTYLATKNTSQQEDG